MVKKERLAINFLFPLLWYSTNPGKTTQSLFNIKTEIELVPYWTLIVCDQPSSWNVLLTFWYFPQWVPPSANAHPLVPLLLGCKQVTNFLWNQYDSEISNILRWPCVGICILISMMVKVLWVVAGVLEPNPRCDDCCVTETAIF